MDQLFSAGIIRGAIVQRQIVIEPPSSLDAVISTAQFDVFWICVHLRVYFKLYLRQS